MANSGSDYPVATESFFSFLSCWFEPLIGCFFFFFWDFHCFVTSFARCLENASLVILPKVCKTFEKYYHGGIESEALRYRDLLQL